MDYRMLEDEVRQQYASVVWTHKVQEKQADIYSNEYRWIETINILSASLTSCGIIATIFVDSFCTKVITAILSFATIFIAAYYKSFNIKEKALENKESANNFLVIRNELLFLIADIRMKKKSVEELDSDYRAVLDKLNQLFLSAPPTTSKALNAADTALNENNEYTFSDEEIDKFLPLALRRHN